jgi:hypothetical protein
VRTVGFLVGTWPENWHRSRLFRVLSLGGYVAFNLPKVVTGLGAVLLVGVAATHVYALATRGTLPWFFVAHAAAVIAGCLLVAGAFLALRGSVRSAIGLSAKDFLSSGSGEGGDSP